MAFSLTAISCASGEQETIVALETTAGTIRLKLYDDTPGHRDNFLQNVKQGLYDGVTFHRIIRNFMIQTGDPFTRPGEVADTTKKDPTIPAEIVYPRHYHKRGSIGAAREGDDENPRKESNKFQFYIVTGKHYSDAGLSELEGIAYQNKVEKIYNEIQEDEATIDMFADRISGYLVSLLPHLKDDQHTAILDEYYRVFSEFERLGDHAVNISDNAKSMADKGTAFSATATKELDVMMKLLDRILDDTMLAFGKRNIEAAYRIQPLRKVAADMTTELKENHLTRMGRGDCNVFLDPNFENLLSDMIRIADVSSNVGEAVIVRVRPEVASNEHTYFADLRHENQDYNRIYQQARNEYFGMLPEDAYGESGGSRKHNALPEFNDA